MSVRQVEEAADALVIGGDKKKKKTTNKPVEAVYYEQELQKALGTKVEIQFGKNMSKGKLIVHYHSYEELQNYADRLKNKML